MSLPDGIVWYIRTPTQIIWLVALLLISGYALWKGGRPERVIAIANLLASFLTPLMPDGGNAADPEWGTLILDFVFLSLLATGAMVTDRLWLLAATAFQLIGVVIHVAIVADPQVGGWAFMTALIIFSYLVLFSLGVGTWLHTLDKRYNLHYP